MNMSQINPWEKDGERKISLDVEAIRLATRRVDQGITDAAFRNVANTAVMCRAIRCRYHYVNLGAGPGMVTCSLKEVSIGNAGKCVLYTVEEEEKE